MKVNFSRIITVIVCSLLFMFLIFAAGLKVETFIISTDCTLETVTSVFEVPIASTIDSNFASDIRDEFRRLGVIPRGVRIIFKRSRPWSEMKYGGLVFAQYRSLIAEMDVFSIPKDDRVKLLEEASEQVARTKRLQGELGEKKLLYDRNTVNTLP